LEVAAPGLSVLLEKKMWKYSHAEHRTFVYRAYIVPKGSAPALISTETEDPTEAVDLVIAKYKEAQVADTAS